MREILNNDYKIWIESEGDSTQVYIDRYYSFGTTGANHRERAIEKIPAAINHVDQLIFVENQKRIEGNKPQNTAMAIGRKLLGFKPAKGGEVMAEFWQQQQLEEEQEYEQLQGNMANTVEGRPIKHVRQEDESDISKLGQRLASDNGALPFINF